MIVGKSAKSAPTTIETSSAATIYSYTWIFNLNSDASFFSEQPASAMQNTRINSLVDIVTGQLGALFLNPWRRLSLLVISLFFGFFLGTAVSTTAGQTAEWDIVSSGILVLLTEIIGRIFYSRDRQAKRPLWLEVLNTLKIGLTYSLFIEAFKLGS